MLQIVKKCERFLSGQCSGSDSKQRSPECKSEVLPLDHLVRWNVRWVINH